MFMYIHGQKHFDKDERGCITMPHNDIYSVALETSDKQGLGRALDPRANGDSLSKLTELNLKSLPMRTEN